VTRYSNRTRSFDTAEQNSLVGSPLALNPWIDLNDDSTISFVIQCYIFGRTPTFFLK
jgi:hypothetical protein